MIANQRHLFDIPEDLIWLNCASRTPLLKSVREAGHAGVDRKYHPWTIDEGVRHAEAERVRALFAGLVGAGPDDIAIQPSAAYGIATAAANLPLARGQHVLVLEGQFPSNVYVWQDLVRNGGGEITTVARPADHDWTAAVLGAMDGLGESLAIAALPPCHWTDGTWVDLTLVAEACHRVGAALVIDATQSAGVMALDASALDADFIVAAGYKWLMGPYTQSFLYAAPRHHEGRPLESHFYNHPGSAEGPTAYPAAFTDGARRFDMGQFMNLINLPMVEQALRQISEWTPDAIQQTLAPLTSRIAAEARDRGLVCTADDRRVGHMVGFGPSLRNGTKRSWPGDIVSRLAAENVHVSMRAGVLRISPHLHTRDDDVTRLFDVLAPHLRD